MRIIEIVILLISTFFPFLLISKTFQSKKWKLLFLISSAVILHFIVDGFRWQMVLAYFIIILIIWCVFKEVSPFKGSWFRKTITGLALTILLLFAWGLPIILPVFNLPSLTGKHQVGSQNLVLKTKQDEVITKEANDKRELVIKIWYPAIVDNEQTEPYLNDGERIGFATKYGLPKTIFSYLNYVKTNTFEKPVIVDEKFPVLIFSHGYYSNASGYYAILEEIASQGYIVLNVNHVYESTGSIFPDGKIKLYDIEYDREHNNKKMSDMAWTATQNFNKATSQQERYTAIRNLVYEYFAAEITTRWSNDIFSLIDKLELWNKTSFLANHMDLKKIGVFGHSQGGAAAGQALLEDNRIKAGINLDGVQWGNMIDTLLNKPFLLVSSDWDRNHPNFNQTIFNKRGTADFYNAKIINSGHSNFMDIPLVVNTSYISQAGVISKHKAHKISQELIIAFFDKYLKDSSINLIELKERFTELEIEMLNKKE